MNIKSLPEYFRNGEKPEKDFRLGLEWEVFIVNPDTLKLVPYSGKGGIEIIMKEFASAQGLAPVYSGKNIKYLDGGTFKITLEPGGQIELSGTPSKTLHDIKKEASKFIASLKNICRKLGHAVMPFPYHPIAIPEDISCIPDRRYEFLTSYFKKFGLPYALNMQRLTTSIQVSIDYCSEADFSRKLGLSYRISPVLSAIYANSPFCMNRNSGYATYRGYIWDNTDSKRCGFIDDTVLKRGLDYRSYSDILLDVPIIMGFGYAKPEQITDLISLRNHIKNHGDNFSIEDWISHISFFYNVVRAKNVIEIRCFDNQQNLDMAMSIPALVKGIFYTGDETMGRIEELFSDFLSYKFISLKRIANFHGLDGQIDSINFLDKAQKLYRIAEERMKKLFPDEAKYLTPLGKRLFTEKCSPARKTLQLWEKNGRNVLNIKQKLFAK